MLDGISRGIDQALQRVAEAAGLCTYGRFRRPVVRYLQRRLPAGANAEALADDVMRSVFDPELLQRASQEGARFREHLLAVTRHHLFEHLRRGGLPETTVRSIPPPSVARCECPCPRCAALRERGATCTCTCGPCTG